MRSWMYTLSMLSLAAFLVCAPSKLTAQAVSMESTSIGTVAQDTTPRPPQVVTTFPSSVSDEALFGTDSLSASVHDIDISIGSAFAKTSDENNSVTNEELLIELKAMRKEVGELREEVKGLRKNRKRKWPRRRR